MREVMTDVGEESPLRLQPIYDRQRVLDRRVRPMWLVPQRIEKQNVEPFELVHRRLWDLAVVGEVSRRPETISIDLSFAVDQNHRLEPRSKDFHRSIDWPKFKLR